MSPSPRSPSESGNPLPSIRPEMGSMAPNLGLIPSAGKPSDDNFTAGNLTGNEASSGTPSETCPEKRAEEPLGEKLGAEAGERIFDRDAPVGQNLDPEDSRILFAQLVEERNLLKQQIALLEAKLLQQNETLTAVYRERDEFRERLRREQRQSNQLKRALESVVERTAETRLMLPMDFPPPPAPRTDGVAGTGEPTVTDEGWASPPAEYPSAGDATDAGLAPASGSVPNNVVLLRPLAEPMPLSAAAKRVLQSQSVELDNPLGQPLDSPEPSPAQLPPDTPELSLDSSPNEPDPNVAIAGTVSPESVQPLAVPIPKTAPPPRPRPMLPAFASRSQPAGAKFLSENSPVERETNYRRTERPEVDCSERPERPVGGQVAPPSFWQDLQKGALPKGTNPPPRKRVTAFAAIQLPDFPPLR